MAHINKLYLFGILYNNSHSVDEILFSFYYTQTALPYQIQPAEWNELIRQLGALQPKSDPTAMYYSKISHSWPFLSVCGFAYLLHQGNGVLAQSSIFCGFLCVCVGGGGGGGGELAGRFRCWRADHGRCRSFDFMTFAMVLYIRSVDCDRRSSMQPHKSSC